MSSEPISIYPGDDSLYYMDFTKRLFVNDDTISTVDAVTIQDESGNTITGLTLTPASNIPNAAAFNNDDGNEVGVGKAALFRLSGATHGVSYWVAVTVTTGDGNEITRRGVMVCTRDA